MLHTYKALLDDDRVRWLDQPPEHTGAAQVHITFGDYVGKCRSPL